VSTAYPWGELASRVVVAGWVGVAAAFLYHRRRNPPPVRSTDAESALGFALQAAGLALCWVVDRPPLSPLTEMAAGLTLLLVTAVVVASVLVVWSALAALGAHWSASAHLETGHRLITRGPYAYVRHPLYSGMLGLILATAVVQARWEWVPLVVVLYLAGTAVRIRGEERALARAHGGEWEPYRRAVPALLPRPGRRRGPGVGTDGAREPKP